MVAVASRCKVLLVGCGSIGRRHLRNLRALGVRELWVADPDPERLGRARTEVHAKPVSSLREGLAHRPDLVVIATPSHLHLPMARETADAGIPFFVEKPLTHVREGLDELVRIVRRRSLLTMVGCNMRFHHGPATMKQLIERGSIGTPYSATLDAGQYLPDWHPEEDYRRLYSARRATGGGVLLDGIHELDYATWLFGEIAEARCYAGRLSPLEIDVEDSANLLVKFRQGMSATIHVDYLQRNYSRSCKIVGSDGTILWDIPTGVRRFSAAERRWFNRSPPPGYGLNDMYLEELRYFLKCLANDRPPMGSVEEAAQLIRLVLKLQRSMEHAQRVVA